MIWVIPRSVVVQKMILQRDGEFKLDQSPISGATPAALFVSYLADVIKDHNALCVASINYVAPLKQTLSGLEDQLIAGS